MSFSSLRLCGLSLLAALSACTVSPLHGPAALDPATGRSFALESLAGRIAVSQADTRTDQVVRNPLLFRLNGSRPVEAPLYEVELVVRGTDQSVSIQDGTGIPTASVYRLEADYRLLRLPEREVVDSGRRIATAPYDRSVQLFAAQRALLDARENAGRALADLLANAMGPALRRELAPGAGVAALPARR